MNIQLIAEQIGRIHLTLKTTDAFEVYGGTWLGSFEVSQTGTAQWTLTVREKEVAAAPLRDYKVYARQLATGREWEVLSGKILVAARTAAVPADKLAPVEYFATVPVVDHDVDAVGSTIVQGIPGPQGPKGDPGPPGEGGMTEEERATLSGAAQRDAANTFTASNTFTGEVDMSTAQVTPPEGWNVEGVTAEQVQSVVPMAFGEYTTAPSLVGSGAIVMGDGATSAEDSYSHVNDSVVIGKGAKHVGQNDVVIGKNAKNTSIHSVAIGAESNGGYGAVSIGHNSKGSNQACVAVGANVSTSGKFDTAVGGNAATEKAYSVALGYRANTKKDASLAIGAVFTETTDSGNVTHTCTTEGTGSITIGAGANTLNNGSTESSNSITIGCKASNKGADAVVLGASAKNESNGNFGVEGNVLIGAHTSVGGSLNRDKAVVVGCNAAGRASDVSIGYKAGGGFSAVCVGAQASSWEESVTIGQSAKSTAARSVAIGKSSKTASAFSVAIGTYATVSDYGAVVFRSRAEDGTYTQLYFSGANTPLANTYHDGAPMLGYVTKDSAGNIVAAGTRSLIDLLTDNSTFEPASLDENGEWVMPKVFHPSDLDMTQDEPSEPEEYTPLPMWPIVEPEVPEDLPPHAEIEKS